MASQETAEPSSQRFVAETPQGTVGDVGATLHVASPPQVVMQHSDLGVWAVETDASKAKAHKGKGATTVDVQMEEGEIKTMASQETVGPSSQRFVAETPQGTTGDVGATLHVASPPRVVI